MSDCKNNNITGLYIPCAMTEKTCFVCFNNLKSDTEIELDAHRVVTANSWRECSEYWEEHDPSTLQSLSTKTETSGWYYDDGDRPSVVTWSVSQRSEDHQSDMRNVRAEFVLGEILCDHRRTRTGYPVYGNCVIMRKMQLPPSMILEGERRYTDVSWGTLLYYEKYFGKVERSSAPEWFRYRHHPPKKTTTRHDEEYRAEWDLQNTEYIEGPEPNPYDGTYSEE